MFCSHMKETTEDKSALGISESFQPVTVVTM